MEKINYKELISFLGNTLFEFVGQAEKVSVHEVKTLTDTTVQSIVWVKEVLKDYSILERQEANLVIISKEIDRKYLHTKSNYLLVENPKLVFANIVNHFFVNTTEAFIHPSAVIDESVELGNNVHIGANVVLAKNCKVGDNSRIMANVSLYENVVIGKSCIIHSGCVLGAPGSGYIKGDDDKWINFPQIGNTVLEDNIEVGALSYINKGAIGETRIKSGTKIGLAVCIGHNVQIGNNCMVIANSVVAGSCVLEDNVWISHGVSILNGITLRKGAFVGMGAVVTKDVEVGNVVLGNPAKVVKSNN